MSQGSKGKSGPLRKTGGWTVRTKKTGLETFPRERSQLRKKKGGDKDENVEEKRGSHFEGGCLRRENGEKKN